MKKLLLLSLLAGFGLARAGTVPSYPDISSVNDGAVHDADKIYLYQTGKTTVDTSATMLELKAYMTTGYQPSSAALTAFSSSSGTFTINSTGSITLTGTGAVNIAGGGTPVYTSQIGSAVQAYSPALATLGGTATPFTAGTNITISGTWPNLTFSASGSAAMTLGSNAVGVLTYSSNVLNLATPTGTAGGLVRLDGSGWIPTGMLGNYIGVSGGVQGYSALTTLLGNTTTGSGTMIVLGTAPTISGATLSGTTTIAALAGGAFGTGVTDLLAHAVNGADGAISYNYVTSYYTPTASLGTLALTTITGTASSSTFLRGDNTWAIAGLPAWELKSSDFTAVAGHRYQVDTSGGAVTVTLPASATAMDEIEVADASLSWNTHNVTLNRNGLKINNGTSNYTGSVQGNKLSVVYISSGFGWSIK